MKAKPVLMCGRLQVVEGWDVLQAINDAFVDQQFRPIQNVRIRHTVILDDPFPDPPQLDDHLPEDSPAPVFAEEVNLKSRHFEHIALIKMKIETLALCTCCRML